MSTKSADLDTIREDLDQLRADVRSLVTALGHDLAGGAGKRASRLVSDLEERASDTYDRLTKETQRYASTVEKSIAEHPVGTAAIALAVGVIISRLLDRSHHPR
jgi:ElaB/YqjD/DUF883 family membrane-anchored ribosome-binding protein